MSVARSIPGDWTIVSTGLVTMGDGGRGGPRTGRPVPPHPRTTLLGHVVVVRGRRHRGRLCRVVRRAVLPPDPAPLAERAGPVPQREQVLPRRDAALGPRAGLDGLRPPVERGPAALPEAGRPRGQDDDHRRGARGRGRRGRRGRPVLEGRGLPAGGLRRHPPLLVRGRFVAGRAPGSRQRAARAGVELRHLHLGQPAGRTAPGRLRHLRRVAQHHPRCVQRLHPDARHGRAGPRQRHRDPGAGPVSVP